MVASVLGSESRLTTSHPSEEKVCPTEPVPEKSSSKRIKVYQKSATSHVQVGIFIFLDARDQKPQRKTTHQTTHVHGGDFHTHGR